MERQGEEVHIDEIEASAGEKSGHMRWVLALGLLLAIVLLGFIFLGGAASQGDLESEVTASGKADAMEDRDSIDSIVSDEVEEVDTTVPEDADSAE